jgi:hypothetical protein
MRTRSMSRHAALCAAVFFASALRRHLWCFARFSSLLMNNARSKSNRGFQNLQKCLALYHPLPRDAATTFKKRLFLCTNFNVQRRGPLS